MTRSLFTSSGGRAGFEREESVKAHGYRRGIFDSACHAGTEA